MPRALNIPSLDFALAVVLGTVVMGGGVSCRDDYGQTNRAPAQNSGLATRTPIQEIEWKARGKGFINYGEAPGGIFGTSGIIATTPGGIEPCWLEAWAWHGVTLQKDLAVALPKPRWDEEFHTEFPTVADVLVLPNNRYLATISSGGGESPLALVSLPTNEVIKKWAAPAGWYYTCTGLSRNGKFAGLALAEEGPPKAPPDSSMNRARLQVGILDVTTLELRWVAQLVQNDVPFGMAREVEASNDGKFIAVGNWCGSAAVVDATTQKTLWVQHPEGVVALTDVAFSSDGTKVYAAGDWTVRCYETVTGKELGQWAATETGKAIYGHRVSCLAISPDDAWVAAGTGPAGQVYLFHVTTNDKPVMLPHGRITTLALSFSPDSQYLASVAGGRIKIWKISP